MVVNVLEGNLREIIGGMRLTEIMNDRKTFAAKVQENASTDMQRMGLEIVSFNIQNIDDDNLGVIENLGIANTVAIQQNARSLRLNAEKEIAVAQAEANRIANDARIASETAIAEQNNALALKQASLKTEADTAAAKADAAKGIEAQRQQKAINTEQVNAEIAKADREAELKLKEVAVREQELDASIRKQADADRYAAEQKAQADLVTRQKQAEAELFAAQRAAEAVRAQGEAEAEATRAKGLAEAEAMDKKAEALRKYGQAALAQQIIGVLPDIIAAASKPIEGINALNIYSTVGEADGTGSPAAGVNAMAPQSIKAAFDMVKSVTGVDLADVMKADTYDAKVNRNISVDSASLESIATTLGGAQGKTQQTSTQAESAAAETSAPTNTDPAAAHGAAARSDDAAAQTR
jgi:flotillin